MGILSFLLSTSNLNASFFIAALYPKTRAMMNTIIYGVAFDIAFDIPITIFVISGSSPPIDTSVLASDGTTTVIITHKTTTITTHIIIV